MTYFSFAQQTLQVLNQSLALLRELSEENRKLAYEIAGQALEAMKKDLETARENTIALREILESVDDPTKAGALSKAEQDALLEDK